MTEAATVHDEPDRPWAPYLDRLRAYVAAGMTIPRACDAVGGDARWSRAKHWLQRGKRLEEPYREFAEAMLEAIGAHEAACHMAIMSGARKDWRAAAYMLDRRDGQRQLEREKKLYGADAEERTVLYYPVALPEGAAPDAALPPEHPLDTVGEPVTDDDEEEGEEHDDDE